MAQKSRIEAEVFFKRKGEEAAGQFQRPHVAVFEDGLGAIAGAHAQKRQVAAPRKSLEVATGVGNPIHFMKGVGKVRHARHGSGHD